MLVLKCFSESIFSINDGVLSPGATVRLSIILSGHQICPNFSLFLRYLLSNFIHQPSAKSLLINYFLFHLYVQNTVLGYTFKLKIIELHLKWVPVEIEKYI